MGWKDVEDIYNFTVESERKFQSYVSMGLGELRESSGWGEFDGVQRCKIGENPYDENILKRYFSHFLNDSRSFLEYIVFSYCEYHNQEYSKSEYLIRNSESDLRKGVNRWRGWDSVHREAMREFFENHSPISDDSRFKCLKTLSNLRNTGMHRLHIIPEPQVEVDSIINLYSGEDGSVTFRIESPIDDDSSMAWRLVDYNPVAKFGEYYGPGYEVEYDFSAYSKIDVNFMVTDRTNENSAPVNASEFMKEVLDALKLIKQDFESAFPYLL